jgi:fatty-acyl-CoA synthase
MADRSGSPAVSTSGSPGGCVIGAKDLRRGETVKAVIVLRPEFRGNIDPQAVTDWARENMATYKVPRIIVFADALPKSGSGKIMWRELQERENASTAQQSNNQAAES